ncbi:NAD(P)-dependent oxidoreductase [Nocardioides sp.]|uniref:NAD(P)-dependent oxidoreductase n=1 Tax=Nocardioides sp. TaxID=35761 RepID=UPI0037849D9B
MSNQGGPRRVAVLPESTGAWLDGVHEGTGTVRASVDVAEGLLWSSGSAAGLREVLSGSPSLRWVHLPVAGIDGFTEVLDTDRQWTCAKGANAEPVAEHALALILALYRRLPDFARGGSWQARAGRSLRGARVVVLGAGAVARALVDLLRPFHPHCVVLSLSPRALEGATWSHVGDLETELTRADVLVLAAAATSANERIIDAKRLDLLPREAVLVNVGRGTLLDHDALRRALLAGSIAGAALDVTDPEPLPDDDPLFAHPGCVVTCHSATVGESGAELLRDRARANLVRFVQQRPLLGVIDPRRGY